MVSTCAMTWYPPWARLRVVPFKVFNAMDSRKKLVYAVTESGMSLSQACRDAGVTRKTGRLWVERAKEVGIDALCERSRAPKSSPTRTSQELEDALVALKERYPEWGPRKLVILLQREKELTLSSRTASQVLLRKGLTKPAPPPRLPLVRFERESCGALLQMDFKGLPKSSPYALLSVLDDYGRFCFHFGPVPDKTRTSVQAALWELFGEHGVPRSMLMDNGDCWGAVNSMGPTAFEVWLMLQGVKPIHGRPGHPETQGKVERFHGTAKTEMGGKLVQPSAREASLACQAFVQRYNWVRPHDSLAGQVPGSRYTPFPKKRAAVLPEHRIPEGALTRKVDQDGFLHFKGKPYRIGKGLFGHTVVLKEEEFGMRIFFQDFPLRYLFEL